MSKLKKVLRRLFVLFVAYTTPRCREVTRLLSHGMDAPLPWHMRLRLRLHFTVCVWCERYACHLRRLRVFSRAFPTQGCEHGKITLSQASRERLKAKLREQVGLGGAN